MQVFLKHKKNVAFSMLLVVFTTAFIINPPKDDLINVENVRIDNSIVLSDNQYAFYDENSKSVHLLKNDNEYNDCVLYWPVDLSCGDYFRVFFTASTLDEENGTIYCDICDELGGIRPNTECVFNITSLSTICEETMAINDNQAYSYGFRIYTGGDENVAIEHIRLERYNYYTLSLFQRLVLLLSAFALWYFAALKLCRHPIIKSIIDGALAFTYVISMQWDILEEYLSYRTLIIPRTSALDIRNQFLPASYSFSLYVLFFVFCWGTYLLRSVKLSKECRISSLIFSFFMISGYCYIRLESFFEMLSDINCLIVIVMAIICCKCFIDQILRILTRLVNWIQSRQADTEKAIRKTDLIKRPFLYGWFVILVCWLPFVIVRYPGGIHWDSVVQIDGAVSGHMQGFSSLLSTYLMGFFPRIGHQLVGSYNFGLFFYVMVQALALSAIFAYVISTVSNELHAGHMYWFGAVAACALCPIYAAYSTSVIKDIPYANLALLFCTQLYWFLSEENQNSPKDCIILALSALLCCAFFNKGVYCIGASGLILLIIRFRGFRKRTRQAALAVLIACVTFVTMDHLIGKDYRPDSEGIYTPFNVMYNQPIQQIARCVKKYPAEFSENEINAINGVLIYDRIADDYDAYITDPVFIYCWRNGSSTEQLGEFLRVWIHHLWSRPEVYLDATLNSATGFFYPDVKTWNDTLGFYIGAPDVPGTTKLFEYPHQLLELSQTMRCYVEFVEDFPPFYAICNFALHAWLLLFFTIWAITHRDYVFLTCLAPSVTAFLICFAAPTFFNDCARYALPIVYANVFYLGLWWAKKDQCNVQSE